MADQRPDLSLSIPCYNEEACIGATARELLQAFGARGHRLELVLVDNGSSDGTGDVIDALIAEGLPVVKVRVAVNEGYGHGVLEGLRRCSGRWVGFICADGQVAAEDVVRLFGIADSAGGEVLVKVRRRFRMDGLRRKAISVGYNLAAGALFGGLGSIDLNGNPKIFPHGWLSRLDLASKDWFLDPEVMLKARVLGLPVVEVNVLAQMRRAGVSHVRPGTLAEFGRNLMRYRMLGPFRAAGAGEGWG